MKYNGPCADTAGSAGEGLRKKGGTPMQLLTMLQRHQPVLEQRIQQHRRLQVKWTDRSIFARYPLETTSMYRIWDGAG